MKDVSKVTEDPETDYDVCIVGFKCFDLLTNAEVPRYLGGIERMLVALARGLAQSGLRVAFVTFDEPAGASDEAGSIAVFRSYSPDEGSRGVRVLHPRMTSLYGAMSKAKSPMFIQMGQGIETLMVAACARLLGARMVYCVASDSDCLPHAPLIESDIERYLYKFGLRLCQQIIAQTRSQELMLQDHFNRTSDVIPMPHLPTTPPPDIADKVIEERVEIIWIGRVVEGKRLEIYVELARLMPHITFHVIGSANKGSDYSRRVLEQAEETENVHVQGRVSEQQLFDLYTNARLLCCTSEIEGFPAIFIEAWSYGLPVVTTFDPDDVVSSESLGQVADCAETLKTSIEQLLESQDSYLEVADRCQTYYKKNYTIDAIIPRFLKALAIS